MNNLAKAIGNVQTSAAGVALGSAYYGGTVGIQIPQTQGDWFNFAVSVLLAILGLLAKDGKTGSAP